MARVSERDLLECLGEVTDSKRDREEIKSIPGLYEASQHLCLIAAKRESESESVQVLSYPSGESHQEECPVVAVEHPEQRNRVGQLRHRRLQAAETGCDILASRHAVVRRLVAEVVVLDRAWVSIGRSMIGGRLLVVRHVGQDRLMTGCIY